MPERPGPAGAFAGELRRDTVRVAGPEAEQYLQGQLSQDVSAIRAGSAAWSWLLAPAGKVDALVRVSRLGDAFYLDTDAGFGEAVAERLRRFKLRTRAEVDPVAARFVAWRGPGSAAAAARLATGASPSLPPGTAGPGPVAGDPGPVAGDEALSLVVVLPALLPDGSEGVDVAALGSDPPSPPEGFSLLDAAGLEYLRVRAGAPAMGSELDERTIPGETGLVGVTVSFTKGCYTGQELVARIDSRGGNVARRLARLVPSGELGAGSELQTPDGRPAGVVTSTAVWGGAATPANRAALGYVRRGVDLPATLVPVGGGSPVEAAGPVGGE